MISTTQILYYKYYPSPLAQMPLIELEERGQQQGQEKEKEERIEMQLLQKNENWNYGYGGSIPLN